jgi:hypothetical protein
MLIIILIIALLSPQLIYAASPQLIISADSATWSSPIYSANGKNIAFTNASLQEIWVTTDMNQKPRLVAAGDQIGKRFVFEPGLERLVYRQKSVALPERPVRLLSTSFYLYDPIMRTDNLDASICGPYVINQKVWYRRALTEPLRDYKSKYRIAAPYLNLMTGKLWVLNEKGDSLYSSPAASKFVALEISPDGKWVAALQEEPEQMLLLISLTDKKTVNVGAGSWPSWSGDSQSLIYLVPANQKDNQKNTEIHVYRLAASTNEAVLTSTAYSPETPSLNQEGTRALFVSKGAIYELILK